MGYNGDTGSSTMGSGCSSPAELQTHGVCSSTNFNAAPAQKNGTSISHLGGHPCPTRAAMRMNVPCSVHDTATSQHTLTISFRTVSCHTLCSQVCSMSDLLAALTPRAPPDSPLEPAPAASHGDAHEGHEEGDLGLSLVGAATKKAEWGGPLLQLQVVLEEGSDDLLVAPQPAQFKQAVTELQAAWVDQVSGCTVMQLAYHVKVITGYGAFGCSVAEDQVPAHAPTHASIKHHHCSKYSHCLGTTRSPSGPCVPSHEQVCALGRLLSHEKLQDLMEKPLDGGDVDVEGFGAIIVGCDTEDVVHAVEARLHEGMAAVEALRDSFGPFRDVVVENRAVSVGRLRAEVEGGVRDLERFRDDWVKFNRQLADIQAIAQVQ